MAAPVERVEDVGLEKNEVLMEIAEDNNQDDSGDDGSDDVRDARIASIDKELAGCPYTYDLHVELISLLRKQGELDRLRHARKTMSDLFPLTEELWLQWFQDELPLLASSEDRANVSKLFDKAVTDYMSVPIWLEYVQYSIGGMAEEDGISKIRAVFERAISAVGIHVAKGSSIWETYREFEAIVLAGMQSSETVSTEDQIKSVDDQTSRVLSLFKRQLAVPLLDMDRTPAEYKQLFDEDIDKMTSQAYKKALNKLEKLIPFEKDLITADPSRLEQYNKYIQHELANKEPVRVQCIYERAIQENPLVPQLWIDYTKYLSTELRIPSVTLDVYKRAIRNCPWTVELWLGYLITLEENDTDLNKMAHHFDEALRSGLTQAGDYLRVWLYYCDNRRRYINWDTEHETELEDLRNVFGKAVEYQAQQFGNDGDPMCELQQYWARIEAKFCKNMTQARILWNDIMSSGNGAQAQMWLDYYKLERCYGDAKHIRKIFQRATNSVSDWPELIFQAYIDFEREEGDLSHLEVAINKCDAHRIRIEEKRAKEIEKGKELKDQRRPHEKSKSILKGRKPTQPGMAPVYARQSATKQGHKRKLEGNDQPSQDSFKVPKSIPNRKQKIAPPPGYRPSDKPTDSASDEPSFKVPARPPLGPQFAKEDTGRVGDPGTKRGDDVTKMDVTVFVSNLGYSVYEDRLEVLFCKCGPIQEIRLVKNVTGKSKGYAYIEFQSVESVFRALKMDRDPVDGRPMYVSPFMQKESKSKEFKFSNSLERNKLFVKNLPLTCTKEALETIFSQHGQLKAVRIVTFKNGTPKGLAFIEYENGNDASKAILKTDGLQIGDNVINVAISNPPERQQPSSHISTFTPSLGGGKKEAETAGHGKARTQVSLMPRSLQKKQAENADGNSHDDQHGDQHVKRSNEDFRNMLLKK